MHTLAPRGPAVKPGRTRKPVARSCRLYDSTPMLLTLTEGTAEHDYRLDRLPSDFGLTFAVRKPPTRRHRVPRQPRRCPVHVPLPRSPDLAISRRVSGSSRANPRTFLVFSAISSPL
jgi:hypothetical protein